MAKYYFSDTHIAFATKKEFISIEDNEDYSKMLKDFSDTVEQWAKENDVKEVFVYDENYNFIWNYNFN